MNNVFNCKQIEATGKQNTSHFPERQKETFWIETVHCLSTKLLFKQRVDSAGEVDSFCMIFDSKLGEIDRSRSFTWLVTLSRLWSHAKSFIVYVQPKTSAM